MDIGFFLTFVVGVDAVYHCRGIVRWACVWAWRGVKWVAVAYVKANEPICYPDRGFCVTIGGYGYAMYPEVTDLPAADEASVELPAAKAEPVA